MDDHEQEHEKQRDPTPPKNPHDEDKDEDSDDDDDGGDKKTKSQFRNQKKEMQEEQGNPLSKKEKSSSPSGSVFGDKRNRDQYMGLGESGAKYVGAKSNLWGHKFVSGSVASSGSGESLFGTSSGSGSVLGDKRNRDSVQDDENGDGSRVTKKRSSVWGALNRFMRLGGSDAKYDAKSSLGSVASSRRSNVGIGGFGSGGNYGVMSNVSGEMRNILGASGSVSQNIGGVGSGENVCFQEAKCLPATVEGVTAESSIEALPQDTEEQLPEDSDEEWPEDTGLDLPIPPRDPDYVPPQGGPAVYLSRTWYLCENANCDRMFTTPQGRGNHMRKCDKS